MFSKMTLKGESYYIEKKKPFIKIGEFKGSTIDKVFDFAYRMSFSGEGEHRDHRTGGTHNRRNGEIFANTFQGKLAECAFYNFLTASNIEATEPDFGIYKLGIWDAEDLNVCGKSISIKSTKSFGNLLLLEEKDWNENAVYLPNQKAYDFTFLIRMNPFCEELMRKNRLLYSDTVDKNCLHQLIQNEKWQYDIPGFVSRSDLIEIITNKNIIPRGSTLNGSTTMDASNYYIQSGELRPITEFINDL